MKYTFEEYKSVSQEISDIFCKHNMNTRADISTVLKMLMLFPYQLSDGSYVYNFTNYKTFDELPDKAKTDLRGSLLWSLKPDVFDKLYQR